MFLHAFRDCIIYHEKTRNHFDRRKPSTIEGYTDKYNLVSQFLFEKDLTKIKAADFTIPVANNLETWLSDKGYKRNYIVSVVYRCGAVLDFAARSQIIQYNPLASLSLKKLPPEPPPDLTEAEIISIDNYRDHCDRTEKAGDMLKIQVNTGFDYGDLEEVGPQHIIRYDKIKFIVKPRNKNGIEAIIPLSPIVERLIKKWNYKLRLLPNNTYNEYLKLIAHELRLGIRLDSKAARKIFCMRKLNYEGFSLEAVSKMAGHKSVKTTEMYYARTNIALISREIIKMKSA